METSDKPKKKYKKHKIGFKIAVDHKLNLSVKQQSSLWHNTNGLYPLYVEVRAKRQRSFFKSQYSMLSSPVDLPTFVKDPLIESLIAQESLLINKHLSSYIEENPDHFDITKWLGAFKIDQQKRLYPKILERYIYQVFHATMADKGIEEWALLNLIGEATALWPALSLATILKGFGADGMEDIIQVVPAYYAVTDYFHTSEEWLAPTTKGVIDLSDSLTADVLFFNEVVQQKISSESKEKKNKLISDLEALKKHFAAHSKNV